MGGVDGIGILCCAQDDGNNKQRQQQEMTATTNNGNSKRRRQLWRQAQEQEQIAVRAIDSKTRIVRASAA
jgi:hypothetical protein